MTVQPTITVEIPVRSAEALVTFYFTSIRDYPNRPDLAIAAIENALKAAGE